MDNYPSNPTPGKTSPPPVDQKNDQGQGSIVKGSDFYKNHATSEWGPDRREGKPE